MATTETFIGLPDAKLPIKSTHTQLVWGCVPVNTNDVQELSVRNYSQTRVNLQVKSISPEFKIIFQGAYEYETYTYAETWLEPLETTKIYVCFCPSGRGPFPGLLEFTSIDLPGEHVTHQHLHMSGYGGHALVIYESRDFLRNATTGDLFLPFWFAHRRVSEFTCAVLCRNHGDVPAFVCGAYQEIQLPFPASVFMRPDKFVLQPQETMSVRVIYTPTYYALNFFERRVPQHSVALGAFYLVAGAEPLRRRVRRITKMAQESGFQRLPRVARELNWVFRNEQHCPEDVSVLREDVDELERLLKLVSLTKTIPVVTQA